MLALVPTWNTNSRLGSASWKACQPHRFDLSKHQKFSGKDMSYFDDEPKSASCLMSLSLSGGWIGHARFPLRRIFGEHRPDENGVPQSRTVLRLHPRLAPVKLAYSPLVKKDAMPEIAARIYQAAKNTGLSAFYDEKGAVAAAIAGRMRRARHSA